MVTREQIEQTLRALNAAENSRPGSTVEEVSSRIDKVMAPDVSGWRGSTFIPNRAAERAGEAIAFGRLEDYHRDFDVMLIDPPYGAIRWTIKGSYKGREIVAPGASVFEFRDDGLVQKYWMHIDPADFAYHD